jgi:hypothetical protein
VKQKTNYKETVVSARRLLQYFQLSDRNSRDISGYIYNFFAVFQNTVEPLITDTLINEHLQ